MNRVVVITGGGTGVGAACARLLAAQGDRVFIIGRRPEPLAALAQEIGAQALVGDAASGESWNHALLPAILREAGRIDCLIGSAGGMGFKRITEMTDAQWQGAMDSNLNSAFASARLLPELIKSGGNLLFVASIASLAAGPEVCGYVTAKLIGLMRPSPAIMARWACANAVCRVG